MNYVEKLHSAFKANALYETPKRGKGGVLVGPQSGLTFPSHGADLDRMSFIVSHYAGPVMYTASKWLEKNKGTMSNDTFTMVLQSKNDLVSGLFPARVVDANKKTTVSLSFRKSLRELSATMLQTDQQYFRCIKPNGVKKSDFYDGR